MDRFATNYRGYIIEKDIYGNGEYTVQFAGDDFVFDSIPDAKDFINDMLLEELEDNDTTSAEFAEWLDSSAQTQNFEANAYSIFEKLSLRDLQKYLKPDSETGFSYNDGDEVPEDNWWYIVYNDGREVYLEPGDNLKGVKRSGIRLAVNDNAYTTMIYGRSKDINIYYDEDLDAYRWEAAI